MKLSKNICVVFCLVSMLGFPFSATAGKLHKASKRGKVKDIEKLLRKGSDVNKLDEDGNTAIHYAKDFETRKLLIENGARLENVPTLEYFRAIQANESNDCSELRFYLENGLDPNLTFKKGRTLLHRAVTRSPSCVDLLIEFNADPNRTREYEGNTPLACCISSFREGVWCRRDPEISRENCDKRYPLSENDVLGVVEILLAGGADVNKADPYVSVGFERSGYPALSYAIQSESLSLVKRLLDSGAIVRRAPKKSKGKTAFYSPTLQNTERLKKNKAQMIELLEEYFWKECSVDEEGLNLYLLEFPNGSFVGKVDSVMFARYDTEGDAIRDEFERESTPGYGSVIGNLQEAVEEKWVEIPKIEECIVYLVSKNTYSKKWFESIYLDKTHIEQKAGFGDPYNSPLGKVLSPYMHSADADASGDFIVKDLPSGDYYLTSVYSYEYKLGELEPEFNYSKESAYGISEDITYEKWLSVFKEYGLISLREVTSRDKDFYVKIPGGEKYWRKKNTRRETVVRLAHGEVRFYANVEISMGEQSSVTLKATRNRDLPR
ncbi:hypothetical protein H8E52_05820 [bacterium]|nr:hypothetical protein [bacterium]